MTIADGYDTTHLNNLEILQDLQVDGDATVTGTLTVTGGISDGNNITLANGKALQTDTTTGHTGLIRAYDVDGTAYKTFATLTNGNTPSFAIAAPSGGTVAIDGAVIGGTTPAAATVTTLTTTSTITGGSSSDIAINTNKFTVAASTGNTLVAGTLNVTGAATVGSLAVAAALRGTFTANGVTPVTVSNANVTANSGIIITLKTVGGTVGACPAIQTITPTTGFTVAATASDTSVYNYIIID